MKWVVLVQPDALTERTYGPFGSQPMAERFAGFVTAEIGGPATVLPLLLPEWELLAHFDRIQGRDAYTEAVEQLLGNGLMTELKTDHTKTAAPRTGTAGQPNQPERTRP